jgi:hypothetical protein
MSVLPRDRPSAGCAEMICRAPLELRRRIGELTTAVSCLLEVVAEDLVQLHEP